MQWSLIARKSSPSGSSFQARHLGNLSSVQHGYTWNPHDSVRMMILVCGTVLMEEEIYPDGLMDPDYDYFSD